MKVVENAAETISTFKIKFLLPEDSPSKAKSISVT